MKRWRRIILTYILFILVILSIDKSLILAFISILIHETSHIVVARSKGCKFENLNLNIYGANVELANINELTSKEKIVIYMAGPLSNIIIIIIFIIVSITNNSGLIETIININISLAIFNLLPVYPLDGSRILEILLAKKLLYKKVNDIVCIISYVIGGVFIFISIITPIIINKYNPSMLLAGIIIIYFSITESRSSMYIRMGNIFSKRKNLIRNKYIENKSVSVYYKQGLVNLMTLVDKNKFNTFFVLDDDLKILFIIHEDELIEGLKKYGNITLEEYYHKRTDSSN